MAVAAAIDRLKHIDTLINVAGVNRRQRVETFTAAADYDFVLDTNLRGAFLMSLEVGRRFLVRLELADSTFVRVSDSGVQEVTDSTRIYSTPLWIEMFIV